MYYRVAIQMDAQPPWKWQSTVLSSLGTLLQWLQVYRAFPQERLRIFSSPSQQELNEQLARENQGLFSSGVPAQQFLQERRIAPHVARTHVPAASTPAKPSPFPDESSMSPLDKRREELEHGAGGDHDLPYQFTLHTSLPQVLSWVKLLARVQQGDFQPEVGAFDERQPQHPGASIAEHLGKRDFLPPGSDRFSGLIEPVLAVFEHAWSPTGPRALHPTDESAEPSG